MERTEIREGLIVAEDDLEHVITFAVSVSARVRHSNRFMDLARRIDALIAEYDEILEPLVETTTTELLDTERLPN